MKVGGQAVIEGVLMMGRRVVVAVRRNDGSIDVRELGSVHRGNAAKIPLIRGILSLFYSLSFGVRALDMSARMTSDEELKRGETFFSILISILLAVGLFIVAPAYLTRLIGLRRNEFAFSLVDGLLRLGIFLVYVWIISLFKDVRRVFQYHGAEHKAVHAFENGEELTVENARRYSTIHPRCGTNFVMIFLIIAILVHGAFGALGPLNMLQRLLVRLISLPIVAAVAYELLKFFDRHPRLLFLALPGLALQKLTTAEPDDAQLEVALVALRHALGIEGEYEGVNEMQDGGGKEPAEEVPDHVEFLG